jgi:hypothetical protein
MKAKKIEGRGRLVPSRTTGIAYEVRFGIPVRKEEPKQGRGMRPARWKKCTVHFERGGSVPDGSYFLYTEEGRVHQLKATENEWLYLEVAA